MNTIMLQEINIEELKNLLREVIEEKLKLDSNPKESKKGLAYLNRFEVAKILKISLPTLNNWSKAGTIQSYRIGNRILYKSDEIEQAVQTVRNLKYKRG
jgi:excisionase family DNA binding protein